MDIGKSSSDNNRVNSAKLENRPIYFPKANSCNISISRLSDLKKQAAEAIAQKKIFTILGTSESVRASLVKRGWIEKISNNRLDVRKTKIDDKSNPRTEMERVILSNFVTDAKPNLLWNAATDFYKLSHTKAKYNRIQCSHLWTTKLGLCAAVNNARWSYIDGVAEVNSPRTYACTSKADLDSFKNDFKLTACTSLLKWLIARTETEQKLFDETGTIDVNIIVFAINRCKEYLFHKQNKDLDKPILKRPSNGQWNTFLKKYYLLIEGQAVFKPDKDDKIFLFLEYARYILREIANYRPQLGCEGCNNIWIIKPAHSSRGRGIRMASNLKVLTELLSQCKYIAQKYIEKPLLIYHTKFDIRQYYLLSNAFPLEIWMYKDSYLKFSSQEYNIGNFHESIHLTNNAVQKKYSNFKNRHPELPQDNMWSSDTFKDYLSAIGQDDVWDKIIYPGMKKSIVGIMTTCQDSLSNTCNRFELYGCDFIIDKDYKPWLIEINSSPDMRPTTTVTSKICPAVLDDVIQIIVDNDASKLNTHIGKFECIYRQTHCPYSKDKERNQNLEVQGRALPENYFFRGSTSQLDPRSNTDIVTQPDITATLQKIKLKYTNKQEQKQARNSFMTKWQSFSKYNLQCTISDTKAGDESNDSSTRKSDTDEQGLNLSDSISSEDYLSTFEKRVVVAQKWGNLLDRITSDINKKH